MAWMGQPGSTVFQLGYAIQGLDWCHLEGRLEAGTYHARSGRVSLGERSCSVGLSCQVRKGGPWRAVLQLGHFMLGLEGWPLESGLAARAYHAMSGRVALGERFCSSGILCQVRKGSPWRAVLQLGHIVPGLEGWCGKGIFTAETFYACSGGLS